MLRKNPKFDIKLKYRKVFEISLIISLFLAIVAFKTFPNIESEKAKANLPEAPIKVVDVPLTGKPKVPPPPKPPIPISAPDDADELPDISIDETELDPTAKVRDLPPPVIEDEINYDKYFEAVEDLPIPIGGIAGIQKKIIYPEIAQRAGIQGRVLVKAFVDENGKVNKAEIVKGIGAGCDEAAIAAVLKTRFKPGKQRGKAVRVQVSIPILFKLN